MGCTPLKSTVLVLLRSVHEIMRAICQVLWLFNCWTFRFLLSVVLIPLLDLRECLVWILEGLGGQAGCHMLYECFLQLRVNNQRVLPNATEARSSLLIQLWILRLQPQIHHVSSGVSSLLV